MADRRRKKRKIWLVPVLAGSAAVLILAGLGAHALLSGRKARTDTVSGPVSRSDGTVVWQGKEYVYNRNLENYLLIGVDNREKTETSAGQADAGQADAIWLAVRDPSENEVSVITIPRDTMTEIELIAPDGGSLGKDVNHISLSYAYGDGGHESCRLTKEAVSNLLYGVPVLAYCAVSMDALPELTESVGMLTVTVPNDSLEEAYPEFAEGAEVTLTPENTETFVRYRDTEVSQSALARTERQQAFLGAWSEAAKQKYAEDSRFPAELYEALEPYMITDMGNDEFVRLAQDAASGRTGEGWSIPGEGSQGADYDEYHVDDGALYEKIIETFYEEAEP